MVHLRVAKLGQYVQEWYGGEEGKEGQEVESSSESQTEDMKRRQREHVKTNVETYAGLLGHACPAGVYEYVEDEVCVNTICTGVRKLTERTGVG